MEINGGHLKNGASWHRISELIFTMLGGKATTKIHRQENSDGVPKLKQDARRGGRVTGNARKELEKELD
jgi:DNA-damage-inducible protein D